MRSSYLFLNVKWREVAQSCPTLCDPMDCSLPGSSIHGIFQAVVLEWVAMRMYINHLSMSGVHSKAFNKWQQKLKKQIFLKELFLFSYSLLLIRNQRWQDGRGGGGCGVHLSPRIHQEDTFRHRSACRTPAESGQEYLTSRKEYIDPCKTWQDKGTRGENGSVCRTGSALGGWGNWSWGPIPTSGQLSESEEKHLRMRGKQLICGSLNGMRNRQSLPQPDIT